MFLAFTYLFVGLAHGVSCTDEAVGANISFVSGDTPIDGLDDEGSTKSSLVAGHCYVCAPAMMPSLVTDAWSSEIAVKLLFTPPPYSEALPRLDTPPPKHLA